MKTTQKLFDERLSRIYTAIALGKPDRVPVIPHGTAFCANHLGVKLSEFAVNARLANEAMFKSFTSLGEIDGVQSPVFVAPLLGLAWLSKIQIPGIELPDDVPWQVAEAELMTVEDYDTVINKGFNAFFAEYQASRLDNLLEKVGPVFAFFPEAVKRFTEAGIVVVAPAMTAPPYEQFCGGRTMPKLMRDLFKMPDKVQAAMDAAMPDVIDSIRVATRGVKPIGAWVGGWRSASEFLSPKIWQRFVWPYMKRIAEVYLEEGVVPIFHLDSNWERDLEFFRELPKGRCIISSDHSTNIYRIKEVLGDHMCIMGDVPAALFVVGSPEDVYNYSTKLIKEIGPSGFILSSGCDIPANAKPENVAAMISAASGK